MLFWIVSNAWCVICYCDLQQRCWDAAPALINGLLKTADACTVVLKMHKRGKLDLSVFQKVCHEVCLIVRQVLRMTNEVSNNYYKKILHIFKILHDNPLLNSFLLHSSINRLRFQKFKSNLSISSGWGKKKKKT